MSSTNCKAAPKRKRKISKMAGFCICGLFPIMALYTYLRFIPIFQTFYLSFFNYNLISSSRPFIGFNNYKKLLQSKQFIDTFNNTTIIAFSVLLLSLPLSLLVANALISRVKTKAYLQSVYFLPVIMPIVPITIAWKHILDNDGFMNYFLSLFGVAPLSWMVDPHLAVLSVIIITVWKHLGYNMMIFSVGLTGINKEYYEAASIDGATGFKSFYYITVPLLKPVTLFVAITTLITGYNVFSTVYVLASDVQGSPGYIVRVLVYDMYENGFQFMKMGYASAEAVILFVVVFVLTLIQFMASKDKDSKKVRA